jgi:hypothetical protein
MRSRREAYSSYEKPVGVLTLFPLRRLPLVNVLIMGSQSINAGQVDLAKQLLEELKSGGQSWSASEAAFGQWKDKVLVLIRQIYGIGS